MSKIAKNLDRMGLILGGLLILGSLLLRLSANSLNQPQSLPVSAKALVADRLIQLEVARTPQQKERGLMHRTDLPADRGMLFLFERSQTINFWMKNVPIHLDILFLKDGVVKAIAPNVPPCKTNPCPTYTSRIPVNQVLELRGGQVKRLGLKIGSRITIQTINHIPR